MRINTCQHAHHTFTMSAITSKSRRMVKSKARVKLMAKKKNKSVMMPNYGEKKEPRDQCTKFEEETPDETLDIKSHKQQLDELKENDPEFYHFLLENDDKLLNFSEDEDKALASNEEDIDCQINSSDDQELESDDQEPESEDDDQNGNDDFAEEDVERLSDGELLTIEKIHVWSDKLKKSHSLLALKQLYSALHCGVISVLTTPDDTSVSLEQQLQYQVKGSQVFNAIVVACLRYVRPTLNNHFPVASVTSNNNSLKPSSNKNWAHIKRTIKMYLTDLLQLLRSVSQASMVCALLRHVEGMLRFFSCFPKLSRYLCRELIRIWSESREEASVLSYLILRKMITEFNEYQLEDIMKRMYLAYVRNSRFTALSTLQHIHFMCGTFVEFLSFSPALAYQLVFLYTRHLANQLRSAFKGKKLSIATWPIVHSLELFTSVLSTLPSEVFSPLVYPITQVALGMIQLLSASSHTPIRLHIVAMLFEVSEKRDVFIPLAPILLEILESQSLVVSRKLATGKIPSLSCMLKLSKIQVGSRSAQNTVLNYTVELLLRLLSLYSSHISFPEITYPIISRLRKVSKRTPLTWLKHHLRQIIDKSNEVSKSITNDRSSLNFSPKDEDKIRAWETLRKEQVNPLKKFYSTWKTIQQQTEIYEEEDKKDKSPVPVAENKQAKRKRDDGNNKLQSSKKSKVPTFELSELEEENDKIEELHFSSDEER